MATNEKIRGPLLPQYGFFRIPARKIVEAPAMTDVEQSALDQMVLNNRLLALLMCAQNPLPAGRFEAPVTGDRIGASTAYILVYENRGSNPVGVAVYALFTGGAGKQVKISLSDNRSDAQVVDYLGNTAVAPSFGKRISCTVIIPPRAKLWMGSADPGFVLVAADLFSIRVLDPADYLNENTWETRK